MGGILRYDGPVHKIVDTLLQCILASVLWIVCVLPVITVGAGSVALYSAVHGVIRRSEGKVWQTFWRAFRENFKQATVVTLIVIPVLAFVLASVYNALVLYQMNIVSLVLPVALAVVLAWSLLWINYLFPCIARFHNTTGQMLKNCGLFVLLHPLWSLLLLLVILAETAVILMVPGLIPLVPCFATLLKSYALESVFRKYIPEPDGAQS